LHEPSFFWHTDSTIPLTAVRHAEIRSVRSSTYIALVLADGEAIGFSTANGEFGKGRAADAINRYICAPAR
jgi:hypothetical protein